MGTLLFALVSNRSVTLDLEASCVIETIETQRYNYFL